MNEDQTPQQNDIRKAVDYKPRAVIWAASDGAGIPITNNPVAGVEITTHEMGAKVDQAGQKVDTAAQETGALLDAAGNVVTKGINRVFGVDKPPVNIEPDQDKK